MDGDEADRGRAEPSAPTPARMPDTATAPAPLRAWSFRLTAVDALAWEMLPRELRGWRWPAFIVFIASAGAWVTVLADFLGLDVDGWSHLLLMMAAGALHWLIATIYMNRRMRVRARRRIPVPLDVEVEDHVDHLLIRSTPLGGATATRAVTFDLVRECFTDTGRLFLHDVADVLIMPLAVFEDADDMRVTAEAWDARADDAQP